MHQTLRNLDRALRRPVLEALGLQGIACMLRELRLFHQQAENARQGDNHLVAAGCRLSLDLNEALIAKLVDTVQSQEQAITLLSQQLKVRLEERDRATRLLHQAQNIRHQTAQSAESAGLGCIL